jgi:hypothetical protein
MTPEMLSEEELNGFINDHAGCPNACSEKALLNHIAYLQSRHQRRMELMQKHPIAIVPEEKGWSVREGLFGHQYVYLCEDGMWAGRSEYRTVFTSYAEAFEALFAALEKLEEEKSS